MSRTITRRARIGTLGYATNQGLGELIRQFFLNKVLSDILIMEHTRHPTHKNWYPSAKTVHPKNFNKELAKDFFLDVDVALFFETPFDWGLIPFCRENGIKTVMMPMYECMPENWPTYPDMILCPSRLDYDYYEQYPLLHPEVREVVYLPIPAHSEVVYRKRDQALHFVHNAGHGGLLGRNGTGELINALPHIRSPIKLTIRSQKPLPTVKDQRVVVELGTVDFKDLWSQGDVFLFPEKFNGLSLPIQEACASGMMVMATDRYPMNTWLPCEPLIPQLPVPNTCRVSPRCVAFKEAVVSPVDIAATVDAWYGKDIGKYSEFGKVWAQEHSWERLYPKYMEVLLS